MASYTAAKPAHQAKRQRSAPSVLTVEEIIVAMQDGFFGARSQTTTTSILSGGPRRCFCRVPVQKLYPTSLMSRRQPNAAVRHIPAGRGAAPVMSTDRGSRPLH